VIIVGIFALAGMLIGGILVIASQVVTKRLYDSILPTHDELMEQAQMVLEEALMSNDTEDDAWRDDS